MFSLGRRRLQLGYEAWRISHAAGPSDELDHPPFDHLTDEQIAALLEYLLGYGPAEETAGARPSVSPQDVAARRRATAKG